MSNTTLTYTTLALSASAASDAESANRKTCEILIANYDGQYATVEQMQSYAQCVERVHPIDGAISKDQAQIAIFTCLVWMILGMAIMAKGEHTRSALDIGFGGFMGVIVGIFIFCVGNLIFWAFS